MTGYLGPVGTFSYMAAKEYTKKAENELIAYKSIYSLIKAVDSGEIESCIVPIENSIEGSVNTTLDTIFFDSKLYITGEFTMRVQENLMVNPDVTKEMIKKIISHPQPIGQCSNLIHTEYQNAAIEYTESTAQAAERISKQALTDTAMIGPRVCSELYGLKIIEENCGDEKNNCTRFVELKKEAVISKGENVKTSLVFCLDNKPGYLFRAIEVFADKNINMIKIESRPAKTKMGTYVFFIDIDGSMSDENIESAWAEINKLTVYSKFLGSYIKG